MIVNILLLILGLVLLVKGADFFIRSSATIAKRLGVSEFVIGLTLVAFGTSIPELASSVAASVQKESGIIIGNVTGSNIANIGLIIGLAAVIAVIKTKEEMVKRDGYIMIFATVLFFFSVLDGTISKLEAGFFLLLYIGYMAFLFEMKPEKKESYRFRAFIRYFLRFRYLITIKSKIMSGVNNKKKKIGPVQRKGIVNMFKEGIIKDMFVVALSGVAIVYGAKYLIQSSVFFAHFFNVPSTLIGISVIAIGTSLPELSVTLSAAKKGYGGMAVGNVIGSNIANLLMIIGVSGLISPLNLIKSTINFTVPFLILMSFLVLIFIRTKWEIKKIEGTILLGLYIIFMVLLFSGLIPF